jgi:hypothetical protein
MKKDVISMTGKNPSDGKWCCTVLFAERKLQQGEMNNDDALDTDSDDVENNCQMLKIVLLILFYSFNT